MTLLCTNIIVKCSDFVSALFAEISKVNLLTRTQSGTMSTVSCKMDKVINMPLFASIFHSIQNKDEAREQACFQLLFLCLKTIQGIFTKLAIKGLTLNLKVLQ